MAFPGTSGFAAEILVFLGTFPVWSWPTVLAVFGVVITAGYILWMIQRAMFGPRMERWSKLPDATRTDLIPMVLLIVPIILFGVYPAFISDVFAVGIEPIVQDVASAQVGLR